MKAVDFLKVQRDHVERLFSELEAAADGDKATIRMRIANALTAYESVEEEIFYYAARRSLSNQPVLRETIEKPGFIEACIVRAPPVRRRERSFDARGELLTSGIALQVEKDERDRFKKPLAELNAQLEQRFLEQTSDAQRALLARDASCRAAALLTRPASEDTARKSPRRYHTPSLRLREAA
jgi:hypothetical protein